VKLTHLRAFEKHLDGASPNHFSTLYVVLGKDPFQRKMAIDKLISALRKGGSSFEAQTLDGEHLSTKELMNELNAMALFVTQRAIVIENADKLEKEATTALENYFEKPNRSIYLILSASSLHHGTNFYKKSEKIGIVLEFPEEKPWEKERSTQEWINAVAAAEGKSIDAQCCQLLVKLLGTQQELLHNEMQKLFCYVGNRAQITPQDISAIVSSIPLDNGWQLGEAIFRRDGAAALRICKGILLDDTPFFVLLRQLRSQFQTEIQVCSILTQGGGPNEVTKHFPYMKGAILDRHIAFSQGYGMQGFKAGLLTIDEAELQAKNSGLNTDFLAELLMIKLTTRMGK
jgi:DNA polymerase III subunit delta